MKLPNLTPNQIMEIIQKYDDNGDSYRCIAPQYNTTAYYVKQMISIFRDMDKQQIKDKMTEINSVVHVKWNGERNYKAEYQKYKPRYTLRNKRYREAAKAALAV